MATGGWNFQTGGSIHVGDLSSRRIIQQLNFPPSIFISLFSAGFFQTKLASQHDGGEILAFSRRRHFL